MGYASLYQERNLASCRIYLELPRPQVDGLNHTAPALLSRLSPGPRSSPFGHPLPSQVMALFVRIRSRCHAFTDLGIVSPHLQLFSQVFEKLTWVRKPV